jgi:ubiquinone/menaquinone biosynthesis C-methylase UbiE
MKPSKFLKLNEAKWDKWANTLDAKSKLNDYLRKAQSSVIALLELKENMNFLDIGCGTGWALGQIAKLTENKGTYYGVDLSSKMIEKAQENFKDNPQIHFIIANVERIPLGDDQFDSIICTHSFHHYLNPDKALNEMFRLLKKGGKVYILDPTADTWLIKVADKIIKILEPEHVKVYSTKEFRSLFNATGLTYLECKVVNGHLKIHLGKKGTMGDEQ